MKSGENGLIGPGSNDYGRKEGQEESIRKAQEKLGYEIVPGSQSMAVEFILQDGSKLKSEIPLSGPAAVKDRIDTRWFNEWLKEYEKAGREKQWIDTGKFPEQSDESLHAEENEDIAHNESEYEQWEVERLVNELSALPEEYCAEVLKQVAEKWEESKPVVYNQYPDAKPGDVLTVDQGEQKWKSITEMMKPLQEHQNHMTFMEQIRGELVFIGNMLGSTGHSLAGNVQDITQRLHDYINNTNGTTEK